MKIVHIVVAEYPNGHPDQIIPCATLEAARREAVRVTNNMLQDIGWFAKANSVSWPELVEKLQEHHGSKNCSVDIRHLELRH